MIFNRQYLFSWCLYIKYRLFEKLNKEYKLQMFNTTKINCNI